MKNSLGIIGMGTMGKSLSLNFAGKGLSLFLFNHHIPNQEVDVAKNFIHQNHLHGSAFGFDKLEPFIEAIPSPRIILLMLPAGEATSSMLNKLKILLNPGDIILDGGNAHYKDTEKYMAEFEQLKIDFLGIGFSGGEEGAKNGPAIMPGGKPEVYQHIAPLLESIAAKDNNGNPCCKYIGKGGSGHFVKMVHNGIEYAEMQLIAEIYSILHYVFHLRPDDIANELESWNQTEQQSYLLKITADILRHTENDILTLDTILDVANHKGTGSWTTIAACELGVPIPTLTAALYARFTSTYKAFRVATEPVYRALFEQRTSSMPPNLQNIYGVARIINHIQGFQLIEKASVHYDWGINISDIAKIWTNGCIIQSTLLSELSDILKDHGPTIAHPKIAQRLQPVIPEFGWFLSKTISGHLPLPCMESAWTYLKSFAQKESPANLIQAQRDYFGAHTYRLKDNPEGPAMHTYWQKNTF